MSSVDKAAVVVDLARTVEALALSGVRQPHPHASGRECFLRVAAIKLGPALVRQIYPDATELPDLEG